MQSFLACKGCTSVAAVVAASNKDFSNEYYEATRTTDFAEVSIVFFDSDQLGESNPCFPWAHGAQCFFAVGPFGQSLLLFLFELAAGCMFVLKLSDQLVFNPINWFSICSDSFKTNMHPEASSNKNNNKDSPNRPTAKKHCAP